MSIQMTTSDDTLGLSSDVYSDGSYSDSSRTAMAFMAMRRFLLEDIPMPRDDVSRLLTAVIQRANLEPFVTLLLAKKSERKGIISEIVKGSRVYKNHRVSSREPKIHLFLSFISTLGLLDDELASRARKILGTYPSNLWAYDLSHITYLRDLGYERRNIASYLRCRKSTIAFLDYKLMTLRLDKERSEHVTSLFDMLHPTAVGDGGGINWPLAPYVARHCGDDVILSLLANAVSYIDSKNHNVTVMCNTVSSVFNQLAKRLDLKVSTKTKISSLCLKLLDSLVKQTAEIKANGYYYQNAMLGMSNSIKYCSTTLATKSTKDAVVAHVLANQD